MVDSISEWPSHCCTVRKSTPAHRLQVANVARNLSSQKSSFLSFARSAHAFRSSKKFCLGLQPEVGNARSQALSDLAFRAFNSFTSFAGNWNLALPIVLRAETV